MITLHAHTGTATSFRTLKRASVQLPCKKGVQTADMEVNWMHAHSNRTGMQQLGENSALHCYPPRAREAAIPHRMHHSITKRSISNIIVTTMAAPIRPLHSLRGGGRAQTPGSWRRCTAPQTAWWTGSARPGRQLHGRGGDVGGSVQQPVQVEAAAGRAASKGKGSKWRA